LGHVFVLHVIFDFAVGSLPCRQLCRPKGELLFIAIKSNHKWQSHLNGQRVTDAVSDKKRLHSKKRIAKPASRWSEPMKINGLRF
jgi:hypothetical protein